MGLDMYLMKKTYVGGNYEHNHISGNIALLRDNTLIPIDIKRTVYIEEEVGYWRKANAIHNWFVSNVQDGKDDCHEYYVSQEAMKELLHDCQKVLDSIHLIEGKVINGYTFSTEGIQQPTLEDGKVIECGSFTSER